MLELDASVVVIMILFAAFSWAVSRLYLRPLGNLLEERWRSTEGTLEEARQKMLQVENDMQRYRQLIQEARADNYRQQEEHRRQATDVRQQILRQGREHYERIITDARREIAEQTQRAKEWMAREADSFSSAIVKKLLA